ncbi:glucosaminidase domain-containing protein, partial [Muricomes intestini]|uniref:glucosaminidase domain-containing protein n=1 Tax=Muricomes intestini TaxID=1796634 RepID=UPI002FE13C56
GTTDQGKVKFMVAGEQGGVDSDEVQVVNYQDAKSVSYYTVSGGRLIHKITTNMTKEAYANSLDNGDAPSYLKEGVKYYSYDGHYFYNENQYSQMLEDYKSGSRSNSLNNNNPYYNYYQFLPLRSVSRYTADELNDVLTRKPIASNSKMQSIAGALVNNQNKYGVNALLVAGIAGNESAWGTSNISQTKNNLFGLNAIDSSPGTSANTFSSVEQCIKEFTETWMSKQYMNPSNWKYEGAFLGNKESGF